MSSTNLSQADLTQLHTLLTTTPSITTTRFTLDLEFVELLSNPHYVQHLAQSPHGYLKSDQFIAYLRYLLYWTTPHYIHYIQHVYSLYMLEQLQSPEFRQQLCDSNKLIDVLHDAGYWHWRSFKYNRYLEHEQNRQQLQPPHNTVTT